MKKIILFLVVILTLSCSSRSGKKEGVFRTEQSTLERFNSLPRPLVMKECAFKTSNSLQHVILQHNDSIIIFQGSSILVDYLVKNYNVGDTIK